MKRRLALVCTLALVNTACDAYPTELESPAPTDHRSASLIEVSENQFAVDFSAYEADQRLGEADWTRIIQHWRDSDAEPLLGDWRALDHADPTFTGRLAALLETPLDDNHSIALRWDALPILEPPLEILVHLWLPPEENEPKVGISWFIPEPDETGMLSGWALERYSRSNGFYIRAMYDKTERSLWSGASGFLPPGDGFGSGGWTWIRLQHTAGEDEGTIRYRVWQGDLEDEPAGWFVEVTSYYFGRDPYNSLGEPWGPGVSGKAGLYVSYSDEMAGVASLWGAFTVGINGAPAPPPPSSAPEASLVLQCEPERPIRGTEVTCTASAAPQDAEVEVAGWTFEGGGHTVTAPGSQGVEWEGPMVMSGLVTVEARVNGMDLAATAQVEVDPRVWDDGIPDPGPAVEVVCPAADVPVCPLAYPPRREGQIGQTYPQPPHLAIEVRSIDGGPNAGFSFVTRPPVNIVGFISYLNRVLMEEDNQFWRHTDCQRSAVLATVREHEAFHVDFFFESVTPGVTNLNRPFEKLVHRESEEAFKLRTAKVADDMADLILGMMVNENVVPPTDPRLNEFPRLDCTLF